MKRTLCLVLVFLMLFSFSACNSADGSKDSTKTETKVSTPISLPYSREDGLNPFFANSLVNSSLMPMLYAGLFKIDANYNAEPDLALSCTANGTSATVTLNTTRTFTDGQSISAEDVVYSFNLAKTSPYYSSSLSYILSASASGNNVVFTTSFTNAYLSAALTFPIVKKGTAGSADDLPIGAGPYTYSATTDGGELLASKNYNRTIVMQTVSLRNIQDTSTLHYNFVVGNIGALFDDMSNGETERLSAGSALVDLNNLVFLGLNTTSGMFTSAELRKALAAVIDKSELLNSGMEGYGITTDLPFNPNWYAAKDIKTATTDVSDAKTYLKNNVGNQTVYILVCSSNNFKVKMAETLASQLNSLGIKTNIESVSFSIYQSGVAAGNYDIYIGEYKMTNDMNIAGLIPNDTSFYSMMAGEITVEEFVSAFNEYQPFIPVCIRYGVLSYSKSVTSSVIPTPNNPFANLIEWYI